MTRLSGFILRFALIVSALALLLAGSVSETRAGGPDSSVNSPAAAPKSPVAGPHPKAPAGVNVGYFDMVVGSGAAYQLPPITAAGQTGISLPNLSAASLTGLQVLFVTNPSNSGYSASYTSHLAEIQAAVLNGMVLVIHDRTVTGANTILPGGSGISITRLLGTDINLRDTSTILTNGLTNTNLDGGNFSDHGYAAFGTLPQMSRAFLTTDDSNQIVTFAYSYFGVPSCVIYSTIPLDFYLGGSGNDPPRTTINTVYAPNVIRYAATRCGGAAADVPESDTLVLLSGGLGGLATWVSWQLRKRRAKK